MQQQREIGERLEISSPKAETRDRSSSRTEFKFYLDATPQERARRRVAQLRHRGEIVDYHEVLHGIVAGSP